MPSDRENPTREVAQVAHRPAEEPGESSEAAPVEAPRPVPDAPSRDRPDGPPSAPPGAREAPDGTPAADPGASPDDEAAIAEGTSAAVPGASPAATSDAGPGASPDDEPAVPEGAFVAASGVSPAATSDAGPGEPAEAGSGVPAADPRSGPRGDGTDGSVPRRPVAPVTAVAIAAAVVAAGFAAYYGWSWYRAAHDESLRFSRARDAVVRAAEQGVQNLNTLDYRRTDQDFTTWEQSSTGALHDQLVQGRTQFEEQVRQARTVTTAKILEAAVTDLDTRTGKAGVIVALQITVTPENGQPATKPSRMRAQLTRTSSGWKLSALGQAPVGSTGSGG